MGEKGGSANFSHDLEGSGASKPQRSRIRIEDPRPRQKLSIPGDRKVQVVAIPICCGMWRTYTTTSWDTWVYLWNPCQNRSYYPVTLLLQISCDFSDETEYLLESSENRGPLFGVENPVNAMMKSITCDFSLKINLLSLSCYIHNLAFCKNAESVSSCCRRYFARLYPVPCHTMVPSSFSLFFYFLSFSFPFSETKCRLTWSFDDIHSYNYRIF